MVWAPNSRSNHQSRGARQAGGEILREAISQANAPKTRAREASGDRRGQGNRSAAVVRRRRDPRGATRLTPTCSAKRKARTFYSGPFFVTSLYVHLEKTRCISVHRLLSVRIFTARPTCKNRRAESLRRECRLGCGTCSSVAGSRVYRPSVTSTRNSEGPARPA